MKKFLLLLILILFTSNIVQANSMQCVEKGNNITCHLNGEVVASFKTQKMSNGLVETEWCSAPGWGIFSRFGGGVGGFCEYQTKTPLAAQNYAKQFKDMANSYNQMIIQKQKMKQQENQKKAIITKEVSITTASGKKITLLQDGLLHNYLIINNKKVKQFDLGELLKVVYGLRTEENVSLEDAQKLMTFNGNHGTYKPEDLLLPNELQDIKFQKARSDTYEYMKTRNIKFPIK